MTAGREYGQMVDDSYSSVFTAIATLTLCIWIDIPVAICSLDKFHGYLGLHNAVY
jgi:hypothetical protein